MATTVEKVIRIDVMTSATANRQIKQLADQLRSVDKSTSDLNSSFRKTFGGLGGLFRSTLGVIGSLGIVNSLQEIVTSVIQSADAFGVLEARFKTLFGNADQARQAIDDVSRISIESGKALDGVSKLYEKAIRAGERFGLTQENAAKITEGFAQSLRVSGASTQEAQAALIQFGQALASGRLQGDEFRSLTENNAFFMNEFAKATGKTLAELRKLGTDGKLTTEFFLDTLLKKGGDGLTLLERINKTAAEIPLTLSQSFTSLGTALSTTIGQLVNFFANAENKKGIVQSLAEEVDLFRKRISELDKISDNTGLTVLERIKLFATDALNTFKELDKTEFFKAFFLGSFGGSKNFLELFQQAAERGRKRSPTQDDVFNQQQKALQDNLNYLLEQQKVIDELKNRGANVSAEEYANLTGQIYAASKALLDFDANKKRVSNDARAAEFQALGGFGPMGLPKEEDKDAEKRLKELQKKAEQERNALQRDLAKLFEQRLLLQAEIELGPDAAGTQSAKLAAENTAKAAAEVITNRDELRKVIAAESSEIDRLNEVIEDNTKKLKAEGEAIVNTIEKNVGTNAALKARDELVDFNDEIAKSKDLIAEFKKLLSTTGSESERSFIQSRIDELKKGLNPAAKDFATILEDNVGKALDSVSDKLADFLLGTEKNFSAVIDSILKNLLKLTVQDFITEQLNLFKRSSGGSGGIFNSIGNFFSNSNFLGKLFGISFADGGIMGSKGSMPLKKYRSGGVANRPQLAMFGEGSMNEAYVPLPDGRSIPVTIEGGGGSNVQVNVYNQAGSDTETTVEERRGPNNQQQLDIYITKRIRDVVSGDVSAGTGVARTMESKYGLRRSN